MGMWVDHRKKWEAAKKKAPDSGRAKKLFSKGLGPLLTEFDGLATRLGAARSTKEWHPENILSLSPKATKVGTEAHKIVKDYGSAATKAGWNDVANAASRIEQDLDKWLTIEPQQWKPTKEYLVLWRRVTVEMALSAAGLSEAKTADDLQKILDKKNAEITKERREDQALKTQLDNYDQALRRLDPAGADDAADKVKEKVQRVLKDPVNLAGVGQKAREDMTHMVGSAKRLRDLATQIQKFAGSADVKQDAAAKSRAEALLKKAKEHLTGHIAAITTANASLAQLPPGT